MQADSLPGEPQGKPFKVLWATPKTITSVTRPGPQGAQGGKAWGVSGCSHHTGSPITGGLTWSLKLKSSIFSFSADNLLQKHFQSIRSILECLMASLIAQLVKNLPAMQETPVRLLGREDTLDTHSSILGLPLWLTW